MKHSFFFVWVSCLSFHPVQSWVVPPYQNHPFEVIRFSSKIQESVAADSIVSVSNEEEQTNLETNHHHGIEQDIMTPFDIILRKGTEFFEKSFNPKTITKEKVFNAILLAASFGYAAHTIINIDSGMSRGWTQNEIAMRIPLDNWNNYETSLAEKPVYTKTMINVVIYLLGDWLSQTIFQKKNILDFDAARTLRNGFIGLCFGPLVHEYYQFSDTILPLDSPNPLLTRVEKIFMDQTIYLSIKASIYVAAVALLAGESFETAKTNVKERIVGIVTTAWKFWPLVHCLTYTIVPAQHRILWVNCVDLFWNAILASMTGAKTTNHDELEPEKTILEENSNSPIVLKQDLISVTADQSLLFGNSTIAILPTTLTTASNTTIEPATE